MSKVEYRIIPGYPGYRAGDDGSVWTCLKRVGQKIPFEPVGEWKQLKPRKNRGGYLQTVLSANGVRKTHKIHSLILLAFVGPCPPGHECRHFPDNDRTNNRLSNIQWGTKEQNKADLVLHGTAKGEGNGRAKMTLEQIKEIRERFSNGESKHSLSRAFGISRTSIKRITDKRQWTHI